MEVKEENKTTMSINNYKYTNFKESVKSKYIQELIISFLNETYKLDLIRYNKKLQNILEININTYKEKSQSLKIGKRDGYCRIYDLYTMALKFEGEYKNGKKMEKEKNFIKAMTIMKMNILKEKKMEVY